MGLVKNISIIGLVAVLSFYRTDGQVSGFTGPSAGATAAGHVTTAAGGTTTETAAAMILEGAVNGDGTIATVGASGNVGGTVTFATTTTSTIFEINSASGAITVSGTNAASLSNSPYTFVVEASDSNDSGAVKGTLTLTITVNGLPTFSSPTKCWYIADTAPASTTLGTYSASADSGETITYTIESGDSVPDFVSPMVGGKLVTLNVMAQATTEAYTLVLQAVDDATLVGTSSVTIFVSVEAVGSTTQACGTAGLLGSLLVVMAVLVAQFM